MFYEKNICKSLMLLLIALLASSSSLASRLQPVHLTTLNNLFSSWFISLSGGYGWEQGSEQQNLSLTPGILKTYTTNNSTQKIANGELFAGLHWLFNENLHAQMGLVAAVAEAANLSGRIWDDGDPQFSNYTYNYKIKHIYLGAQARLLLDTHYYHLFPWISVSMGAGFNQAYDFNNTPIIFTALPNPNFSSGTSTTFSYTVGIGLQYALGCNWQIGAGYEFADWGQNELSSAPGQINGNGLTLQHLYTNGFSINITYLN